MFEIKCFNLDVISRAAMAEGGHDVEMMYTKCIKEGAVYKNPWLDGNIPSFFEARHFLTESNLSNVPGKEVSWLILI